MSDTLPFYPALPRGFTNGQLVASLDAFAKAQGYPSYQLALECAGINDLLPEFFSDLEVWTLQGEEALVAKMFDEDRMVPHACL